MMMVSGGAVVMMVSGGAVATCGQIRVVQVAYCEHA